MSAKDQTTMLQGYIDKMLEGDDSYRQLLVDHAYERMRWHVKKQMARFGRPGPVEQTDDVLQEACLRLWKSLEAIKPRTVREFFGLAATQIRRTLIDLARYHRRKRRGGGKHATNERGGDEGRAQPEKADDTSDPAKLAVRTEFHESVGDLPQDLREVFGLLHYHGVTQPEAAALLGISERTVKRKWLKAKLALADAVRGDVTGHE